MMTQAEKMLDIWGKIYGAWGCNDDSLNYLDREKKGTLFGEFDDKYECELYTIVENATEKQLVQMTKELTEIYTSMS